MAIENEKTTIEQFTDGGEAQPSNDWVYIRRENPSGSGKYQDYKLDLASVNSSVLGGIRLSETFVGGSLNAGSYYIMGSYIAPTSDANLTQGSPTQTLGTADVTYGAHAFVVVSGVGSVDAGTVRLTVSGASVDDDGVYNPSATEDIIPNIVDTSVVANAYFETTNRWVGQITYTLQSASGSPTTFSFDFNYGFAVYEKGAGNGFTVDSVTARGHCGTTDTVGFDVLVYNHPSNGDTTWTYSAAAFEPGSSSTTIFSASAIESTVLDLVAGSGFNVNQSGLNTEAPNGVVCKVIQGTNNAISYMNVNIGLL